MATEKERALEFAKNLKPDEGIVTRLSDIPGRAQNSETCVDGSIDQHTWERLRVVELAARTLLNEVDDAARALRHVR